MFYLFLLTRGTVIHLVGFWQELIPIIKWEIRTFTHPVCGLLVFASVAVFPTILLPSTPSMWIAGMTFGYGYGFLLIISAASVGVSLPYFIGHLFRHQIQVNLIIIVFFFKSQLHYYNAVRLIIIVNDEFDQ